MTLEYTIFESCAVVFSLIMVDLSLAGGKSDYFKGVLLVAVYLVYFDSKKKLTYVDYCCDCMVLTSALMENPSST